MRKYFILSTGAIIVMLLIDACTPAEKTPLPGKVEAHHNLEIVDSTHVATGLKDGQELPVIIAHCTACHSARMITQNRATREGWKNMITWMQKTQKLWDLGENEEKILDYLERNYAPDGQGQRREVLSNIEWYELD
ncbi:MAG: hypothetical protein OEX02_12920 [Cyclobacteriaceae bacterium]|nr:hypothetical protein [Cyclobacteriaceae bacterium]